MTLHSDSRPIRGPVAGEPRSLPPHGGYRRLLSFQKAKLCQDLTMRFVSRYGRHGSRTRDQMEQAARSGVQNIAEGSQRSGTSREAELKLTDVARASLEELHLDYMDHLRHRRLPIWKANDPRRREIIELRFEKADAARNWINLEARRSGEPAEAVAANFIIVLLAVANSLLDRQIEAQARAIAASKEATRYRRQRR